MIIEKINIKNFRQFYGEISLDFSIDPKKNITVVHGANGSGKTSLLNAFKWCFYDETDFDTNNDNILNLASVQDKKEGGLIECKVAVKFLHENLRYEAIRTQKYTRGKGLDAKPVQPTEFALDVTGPDGQTKRSRTPFVELSGILPENLQPYFFFNGERIEKLAGVNQSVQIQDAIRKLMGLDLVERAINHTGKVKSHYRRIVKEGVSDEQKNLHTLVEALDEEIKRHDQSIVVAKRSLEFAQSELSRIERELKKYEKSRGLQDKRAELEGNITKNNIDIEKIKSQQKRLINENAFLVVSLDMFNKCGILVDDNRKKGVLPYGIKEQFIDDRIKLGSCICGTEIKQGSKEHQCLLKARENAGSDTLESTYTGLSALLKNHQDAVSRYRRDYAEHAHSLKEYNSNNDRLRVQIDEISAQFSQLDDKLIAKLEYDHTIQVRARDISNQDIGVAVNGKKSAESKRAEHNQTLKRLEDEIGRQDLAKKRMDKAEQLEGVLTNLRASLANQVRIDLSARVDKIFQSIIRKPLRAVIDDDYRLQVLKKAVDGNEYSVNEQSTGERQVTSLSFISSIISLAKEKHSKQTQFFHGGLYPLVMDSPFGALDDDYREKVAGSVSQLAEQVIMFVSNSQWSGKVKEACVGKVGKSYQLIYHSPKIKKENETEYMVSSTNGHDYSTVNEVKV